MDAFCPQKGLYRTHRRTGSCEKWCDVVIKDSKGLVLIAVNRRISPSGRVVIYYVYESVIALRFLRKANSLFVICNPYKPPLQVLLQPAHGCCAKTKDFSGVAQTLSYGKKADPAHAEQSGSRRGNGAATRYAVSSIGGGACSSKLRETGKATMTRYPFQYPLSSLNHRCPFPPKCLSLRS